MLVSPNTSIRAANSEELELALDVDRPLSRARLAPRFGEGQSFALQGNAFEFPTMAAPDLVKVEWLDGEDNVAFVSEVEVVSRHYFALDELRRFGDGQDEFDALDDEVLWKARQAATEVFEKAANRSFVQRVGSTRDYGRDRLVQLHHCDVYELLTDGYAQVSDCQVERDFAACRMCRRECDETDGRIEYLYGYPELPDQVSRAVLELAAYMLRPTNRPIGATGESTDAGYIHFTTAGRDGATDIPEVNAAAEMFGRGRRYAW